MFLCFAGNEKDFFPPRCYRCQGIFSHLSQKRWVLAVAKAVDFKWYGLMLWFLARGSCSSAQHKTNFFSQAGMGCRDVCLLL